MRSRLNTVTGEVVSDCDTFSGSGSPGDRGTVRGLSVA